jgi:histidine ammonia-lyase
MGNSQVILIDGATLTLARAEAILRGAKVVLANNIQKKIEASHTFMKQQPTVLNQKMSKSQIKSHQLNLLKSQAAGSGAPLALPETRLALCLKLNTLVKGFSGVSFPLCNALFELISAGIIPLIPEQTSSCAHLALALVGEGSVHYRGKMMPAAEALKKAKLEPIELQEKEAQSLIQGPHLLLAKVTAHLCQANVLLRCANKLAALSFEALEESPDSLHPLLHEARDQPAAMAAAEAILDELTGSSLLDNRSHNRHAALAATPQRHGAAAELLASASQWIEHELNAALDDPLFFPEQHLLLNGGNCDPTIEEAAASQATRALHVLIRSSADRLNLLLGDQDNLHVGYRAFSSLIPEPTTELAKSLKAYRLTLALEMLAAAHAIDCKKIGRLGKATQKLYTLLRAAVPKMTKERVLTIDIEKGLIVLDSL